MKTEEWVKQIPASYRFIQVNDNGAIQPTAAWMSRPKWLEGRNEFNKRKADTMKTQKHLLMGVLMAALLAVGGTVFASKIAAWSAQNWGSIELANVGDEPAASGVASLRSVTGMVPEESSGTLTVKCKNLTPGATYWTPVGTFTANQKGAGSISARVGFYVWLEVVRLDADGSATTVLWGIFDPPAF